MIASPSYYDDDYTSTTNTVYASDTYFNYDYEEPLNEDHEYNDQIKNAARICKDASIKVKIKAKGVKHNFTRYNRKAFGREFRSTNQNRI